MTDPQWLVHGEPEQVLAALAGARGREEVSAAAVYRASGQAHRDADAERRRQLLALDAARYGDRTLAQGLGGRNGDARWTVQWATGAGLDSRLRHALPAPAEVGVVAAVVAAGRGIAVAGCQDGTLHWWDAVSGGKLGAVAADHHGPVVALTTAVLDGRPTAVTSGRDAAVRVWDLTTGELVGTYRPDSDARVTSLASALVAGPPVVVGGCVDGVVRVWPLTAEDGCAELSAIRTGSVRTLATAVRDGRPVVVTGHRDGGVRMWDLVTGREFPALSENAERPDGPGPACGTLALEAVTHIVATDPSFTSPSAVTSDAHTLRLWNLATGEQTGDPVPVRFPEAAAVCLLHGRPAALLSFHGSGQVEVRDLPTLEQQDPPLTGHTTTVRGTATAVVQGRLVAVTGGDDRSVRVWDLDNERPADRSGPVHAIATTVVDGRCVLVTAGADPGPQICDLDGEGNDRAPLGGAAGAIRRLAVGMVEGRPTLLARDHTQTVRVWDLTTREQLPGPSGTEYTSPSISFFAVLEGRFVAVTSEGRVWDLTTSRWIGVRPRQGIALALEALDGRGVVLTADGGTVHLWDLDTGEAVGRPMTAHAGTVRAGGVGLLDGRLVVATGDDEGDVRVWDATTGQQTGAYAFPTGVGALAVAPDGRLVVRFGPDLAVLSRPSPNG